MTAYRFDDRAIDWAPFNGFEGLYYSIQSVDRELNRVDMLMKFDPETNCVPHTHVGVTKTLVLEGEHRIYKPGQDGALGAPDIRPAGTFSENRGDETHVEVAGRTARSSCSPCRRWRATSMTSFARTFRSTARSRSTISPAAWSGRGRRPPESRAVSRVVEEEHVTETVAEGRVYRPGMPLSLGRSGSIGHQACALPTKMSRLG